MPKKKEDTVDNRRYMSEMSQDDFENYAASTQYSYILLARDIKEREKKNFLGHLDVDLDWTFSFLQRRKQEICNESGQDRNSNSREKRSNVSRESTQRNSNRNVNSSRTRKVSQDDQEEYDPSQKAINNIMTAVKELQSLQSTSGKRTSKLESKVSKRDAQIADLNKRIEKLENTVSEQKIQITQLKETVSKQQDDINQLKLENSTLTSESSKLKSENMQIHQILKMLSQSIDNQKISSDNIVKGIAEQKESSDKINALLQQAFKYLTPLVPSTP